MSEEKPPRRLRAVLFGLIAIGLWWAIASHTFVAALTRIEPDLALMVRSDDPGALEAMADRSIDQMRRASTPGAASARFGFTGASGRTAAPSSEGRSTSKWPESEEAIRMKAELQQWALAILAQEPGNVRALVVLGELKRDSGESETAATFMRASAQRSIREPAPQAWLIDEAIEQRDWPAVMRHADILMRMHKRTVPHLAPLIARLAEVEETVPLVREALRASPPWRTDFLSELTNAASDARTPLGLLLSLKDSSTPPTAAEIRAYLGFLVHRKYYDLAYYTWLQLLPQQQLASVGLLVNGSFETKPSGLPFDWTLPVGGSASVSIARRPDRPGARALVVNFGHGRVELGGTSQLLRLRPGDYQVEGEAQGDVVGRRSVRWRVACLDDQKIVGQSDMFIGEMITWAPFSFTVSVPETGCPAQRLSLDLDARSPTERLVSGTIWFDEISIRRGAPAAQPQTGSLPPQSQARQR